MQITPFNWRNWYWLADDGRVYGSERQLIVTTSDADYVAWMSAVGSPTAWPRDDSGNQTNAALLAVVSVYGLSVP